MELFASIFYCSIYILKLLLALTMLSTESCLWFNCPVLVAYKKVCIYKFMPSLEKNVQQIEWPYKNLKISPFFVMPFKKNHQQKRTQGTRLERYMRINKICKARSSRVEVLCEKSVLKKFREQGNTCARASFLIKL